MGHNQFQNILIMQLLKQRIPSDPEPLSEFTNLHIREFPAELQGRAKAAAAMKRMPLRDWVIAVIERELSSSPAQDRRP
jgi:hypothetical protein